MKIKVLDINLKVFENDEVTTYKYGFKNQEVIEKLMKHIVDCHAEEMFEFMFGNKEGD